MQEVQVLKKVVAIIGDDGKIERRYAEEQHGVKRDDGNWIGQPDLRPREISATEAVVLLKLPFSSTEDAAKAAQKTAEDYARSLQEKLTSTKSQLELAQASLRISDEANTELQSRIDAYEAREAAVQAALKS